MRITLTIIGLIIALTGFSQSNDSILIKGELISKDKNPIPGVSVQINGTLKGTVTDVCGQFELWAPIEGVLKFSMISEPYYISLCSFGLPDKNDFLTFKFDFDQKNFECKNEIKKGRVVKLDKKNRGNLSEIFLACYDRDFKKITNKYYDKYKNQDKEIIFFANGDILDADFDPNKMDYTNVKKIFIIRNIDTYDKILFMISIDEKKKKPSR